jgi:pilus assembly protein Flp/PilA
MFAANRVAISGKAMRAKLKLWLRDESGATAIEYGLIASLVSIAAIGSLQALGQSIVDILNSITDALDRVNARLR